MHLKSGANYDKYLDTQAVDFWRFAYLTSFLNVQCSAFGEYWSEDSIISCCCKKTDSDLCFFFVHGYCHRLADVCVSELLCPFIKVHSKTRRPRFSIPCISICSVHKKCKWGRLKVYTDVLSQQTYLCLLCCMMSSQAKCTMVNLTKWGWNINPKRNSRAKWIH